MGESDHRYSTGLTPVDQRGLSRPIIEALDELSRLSGGGSLSAYDWDRHHVAVTYEVQVGIPTGGPVDDVDIHPLEPVLILFHRRYYPVRAPRVYSDRKDFPYARLPHLIPTGLGHPSWLCLHRGNIDDWFAEHSLGEFVARVQSWLSDAAGGYLIRSDDAFEPTRMEQAEGIIVYDIDGPTVSVRRRWTTNPRAPGRDYATATLLSDPRRQGDPAWAIRVDSMLGRLPEQSLINNFVEQNCAVDQKPRRSQRLLSLFLWPAQQDNSRYFGHLPTTLGELKTFCQDLGIDLQENLKEFETVGTDMLDLIPISIAVLRPCRLIDSDSSIEWLNFLVIATPEHQKRAVGIGPDAAVHVLAHRQPLTPRFAAKLSGEDSSKTIGRIAVVGCGAIGSKVSLHLARAGLSRQLLVDNDTLSPHNFVRHGLLSGHLGENKAKALREEILDLYWGGGSGVDVDAIDGSGFDLLDDVHRLSQCSHLLDASASSAFCVALANADNIPAAMRVLRCEIADQGKLGFLYAEGQGRNPRIDDLFFHLVDLARGKQGDRRLLGWLSRHRSAIESERGPVLEEIGIGVGCSSTTLRLADDVISFHAAEFALGLRRLSGAGQVENGFLFITFLNEDTGIETASKIVHVTPVRVMRGLSAPDWWTRISAKAVNELQSLSLKSGRNETGGLLVGRLNHKAKTIYVTHALPPSRDSRGSPYAFKRGIQDYPGILNEIRDQTGGLLWYVGEWHSHPHGELELSRKDKQTVGELRANLDHIGYPSHVLVVGPKGMASHVFVP